MFTLFVSVGVSLVLLYVICVCSGAPLLFTLFVFARGALVLFTLFVFVEGALFLFYVICVVGGAPVLFTFFVFVEEVMSCLRFLFL